MSSVYKLRYPTKVGPTLHAALTEVEVLKADDPRVQTIWPGIPYKPDSQHVAIKLPSVEQPCLVKLDQLMEVQLFACSACGQLTEDMGVCADCQRDAHYT